MCKNWSYLRLSYPKLILANNVFLTYFFFLIRWIWMIVDWKKYSLWKKNLALFDERSFIVFSFNNHPNSSDFCFQLRKNRSGAHCLLKLASDNFNFLHALFSKIIPNSWRTVIHCIYKIQRFILSMLIFGQKCFSLSMLI